MKIAFADLLFSWPPHGGANVDLFQIIKTLGQAGHEVKLFALRQTGARERGAFDPEALPFPAAAIETGPKLDAKRIAAGFQNAIDAWQAEAVFVGCGFFLKPCVIEALAHYPLAVRYYSYEAVCHRDILQYKNGAPCPESFLDNPDHCRRCALDHLAPALKRAQHDAWTEEYLAAGAYAPAYHGRMRQALRRAAVSIVSNPRMAQQLEAYCPAVIVPGGVDLEDFPLSPPPTQDKKVILMTGRGEDPAKGVDVLQAAGEKLARVRGGFEIRVTMPEDTPGAAWFKPLGWCAHAEVAALYREADICAVPSRWEEPFGLTEV